MLIRLAIAIALSPLMLVADMMPADPPCVLLCAGNLPNAVTQLGLIPAPVGFPPNGVTFNGDGGSQATVQILNQEGDVIGAASAAGESIGASRTISVGGGQLNNFGSVSANAGVTIDPDFFATASAHTIFDFWVQLVPPQCGSPPLPPCPTGFIPITITDRFDIGFVPGSGNAVAQVKVSGDFGPSQPLLFADEFFDPVNTSVSHRVLVPPDAILQIEMEAKANEFGAGGGTAEANADPSFQIDPSVPGASSFSFAVSPDLAPSVPEPGTLLLVGFGLAAVGAAARRRRSNKSS